MGCSHPGVDVGRLEEVGDEAVDGQVAVKDVAEHDKVGEHGGEEEEAGAGAEDDFFGGGLDRFVRHVHAVSPVPSTMTRLPR